MLSNEIKITNKIAEDIALAEKLCKELKSGNKKAIEYFYDTNYLFFFNFIKKRLYESERYKPEDVFQDFWEELMDGKIFCYYKGKSILLSYLCSILYNRIRDINRVIDRERKRSLSDSDTELDKFTDKSIRTPEEETIEIQSEEESRHKEIIQKELVLAVCFRLSDISPKDAAYIKMRFFEGLKFEDMARRELGKDADDPEKLKKKVDAIKKQFTRPRTGTMARFRIILERIMKEKNLDIEDIFID